MTVDKWERRQLCEDGACVGVIGQDGICKTCGKPAPDFGDLRKPGRVSSVSDVDEDADEAEAAPATTSPAKVAAAKGTKVAAWNERRLCSDGTCIGLIGDDGKCKVCRKPADGSAAETDDEDDQDEDDDELAAKADDSDEADDDDDGRDDEDDVANAKATDDDDDEDDDEDDDDQSDEDDEDDDDDEVAQGADGDENDDDDEDGDDRKLCSDGACIGVIGGDGKCKTCGKAAA